MTTHHESPYFVTRIDIHSYIAPGGERVRVLYARILLSHITSTHKHTHTHTHKQA